MRTIFTSTLAFALAAMAGQSLYAEKPDDSKDHPDKKHRGNSSAQAETAAPAGKGHSAREAAPGHSRDTAPGISRRSAVPATRAPVVATQTIERSAERTHRAAADFISSRQPSSRTVERARSNDRQDNGIQGWGGNRQSSWQRYSGYRAPSNIYRDWDRNRSYSWNDHRYHWYDGSWIIIDPGYDYVETRHVSSISTNLTAEVQSELQRAGYDPGPADGLAGGRTRDAIARYQGDHGLRVTGRIDHDLVVSLRIN